MMSLNTQSALSIASNSQACESAKLSEPNQSATDNTLTNQTAPVYGKSIPYSYELMFRPSVTPLDAGCQEWLATRLKSLGFTCHHFEVNGVKNLVAEIGQGEYTVAFAGHTDVVPAGPLEKWQTDPFRPQIIDDELIGRGAADMKTGLAAMLAATERAFRQHDKLNAHFVWLVTSDEEGEAEYGSKAIKAFLDARNINIDYCIVGEPSAKQQTGDAIKVGRRGAISARVNVTGKQGHVAYPQYADNAIHKMARVINALEAIEWDAGSDDFPGTSLQITHVDSGEFTDNIVPATCAICFNIRYSHHYSQPQLETLINEKVQQITEDYQITWERACEPYFTSARNSQCLITAVEKAIHKNTGKFPVLSTAGGTSDGRFFASENTQVVEVGVPNQTIHQVNERINVSDLVTLEDIYTDLLSDLLFGIHA